MAYGLALQGLNVARLHTNLLPQDIQVDRLIRAKKPWAVTAAASLLLGTTILTLGYEAQHRAVIWLVVDEHDRVLIRSFRGPGARWYREALAHPECTLHVDDMQVSVTALPARDPARIAALSHGYLAKYSSQRSTMAMLTPENLPTTLELLPR